MNSHAGNSSGGRNRPSPRGRVPLSPEEIIQLDIALVRAFLTIRELREELPAARHIKSPPLPSIFSESIIIAAGAAYIGVGMDSQIWRRRMRRTD